MSEVTSQKISKDPQVFIKFSIFKSNLCWGVLRGGCLEIQCKQYKIRQYWTHCNSGLMNKHNAWCLSSFFTFMNFWDFQGNLIWYGLNRKWVLVSSFVQVQLKKNLSTYCTPWHIFRILLHACVHLHLFTLTYSTCCTYQVSHLCIHSLWLPVFVQPLCFKRRLMKIPVSN